MCHMAGPSATPTYPLAHQGLSTSYTDIGKGGLPYLDTIRAPFPYRSLLIRNNGITATFASVLVFAGRPLTMTTKFGELGSSLVGLKRTLYP